LRGETNNDLARGVAIDAFLHPDNPRTFATSYSHRSNFRLGYLPISNESNSLEQVSTRHSFPAGSYTTAGTLEAPMLRIAVTTIGSGTSSLSAINLNANGTTSANVPLALLYSTGSDPTYTNPTLVGAGLLLGSNINLMLSPAVPVSEGTEYF